ncbi:hypothetical protein D3C71_1500990 [compost metagenome]
MNQHAFVVEGDQTVCLVTVRQKRARHRFADDQANHRMTGQTRIGIRRSRTGQRLMNTERLFAATIRLARHVNHRHNRAFDGFIGVRRDGFADHFRQRPAFQQPHFTLRSAWEMVVRIWHHGDITHAFAVQFTISCLY